MIPRITGRWSALTIAAGLGLVLVGCGGGGSKSSSSSGSKSLAITMSTMTTNVDPLISDNSQHDRIQLMYEAYLIKYPFLAKGAATFTGATQVAPDLASSWKVAKDGIEFTLREAKSEYGNTLTADDVKWSLDRSLVINVSQGPNLAAQGFDTKKLVSVVSKTSVRLAALPSGLSPDALGYLSQLVPSTIIDSTEVKKHATAADPWAKDWLKSHSASFGPYRVDSIDASQQVNLVRNENYYGDKPAYEKVTVVGQSNPATGLQQLKSGQTQIAAELPYSELATIKSGDPVQVVTAPSLNVDMLMLNKTFAPFRDENVRRAISLALDREALIKGAYSGVGQPATSPANRAQSGLKPFPPLKFDLAAAKQAMASSAYASGFSITLGGFPGISGSVDLQALYTFLKSQLSQIRINVTIQLSATGPEHLAALQGNKYQAYLVQDQPAIPDVAGALQFFFVSKSFANFQKDSNPAFDTAITKASFTPIGPARDTALNDAVQVFMDQMLDVPMVETSFGWGMSKTVCGFVPSPRQNLFPAILTPC